MNKIYKVMYSKVKQCCVVVSEIAKSHSHNGESSGVRKHAALTAAVLIALGGVSLITNPEVAYADLPISNGYYLGISKADDSRTKDDNANGKGAGGTNSITIGHNSTAGTGTITIGDRRADDSKYSVYLGEHYTAANQAHPDPGSHVTSIGYDSDARGTGSIALGSGAEADVNRASEGGEKNPDADSASVAIGYQAKANKNNIAIGAGSVATAAASKDKAYLSGQDAVSSYVSVGKSDALRRISNVADGAADSDVATIGQLKKLSARAGVYNEGWGIKIGDYTKKDANGQETTVKNAISIDRNLGSNEITSKSNNTFEAAGENSLILGGAGTDAFVAINGKHREKDYGSYGKDSVLVGGENNKTTKDGTYAVISGGGQNIASGEHSFIGGGWWNTATGATSTVVGGQTNTASGNQSTVVGGQDSRAIGDESTILGGSQHTAVGKNSTISGGVGAYTFGSYSSVSGGQGNVAIGMTSSADGGWLNFAYGDTSQVSGGYSNYALGNYSNSLGGRNGVVQGNVSVGIAGGSTGAGAGYALAAGYQSVVTGDGVRREKSDDVYDAIMEAGKDAQGNEGYKYTDVATALGYQATANETNTVSFGHDKGDVSGYTVNWDIKYDTDDQGNIKFNEDGMPLVESIKANGITTNHYDSAKYNRLVKVADGINNHDVVVMEQLRKADNVGKNAKNNVVVYKGNKDGTLQVDENGEAIIDVDASKAATEKATEQAIKDSEDAWGSALGTGKVEANNSQLVTGDTVYDAIQNQAEWKLTTNGESADKAAAIKPGTTVNFSAEKRKDHSNVTISHNGSNVTIGLDKDIVLGEATNGNGGSLNVYSDSTEASNLGNRVSIDGSTVSVNYGKEDGTLGTKRGVVLGVGEDYNNNAQGYIAFNNIDAEGTIGSTYLHSATDAPNDLKGRLVYSNAIDGTEYIANLDDGITFTGDVQKDVPEDYTQTPTKLNTTLNITGGAATEKDLTEGNIGVVSTPAAESADGTTQASKLEIKLNKDLKGITSITSQTTDGTTSGATITLGTNGTTISGGDVNVSTHKITGLKDGAADTDAATVGQMKTAIGDAKTKYYSVQEGLQSGGFRTNENNDGASSALAGLAAGYETGTTGIASTVVGSYSGVIGSSWLQGAAAVSVGTVNVNSNTDTSKPYSGVANSIVGQANTTTNSNAAIIYGAGNTVTDSYRPIDPTKVGAILGSVSDPKELSKAMKAAVKDSGGQVMVMGGGNTVDKAYMTQVTGVGNTVKGNQVESKGEWVTETSNTAIKYDPEKSSQYNYVDGFNNEVINGKHDYVIGANNKLDGDSYDDNNAKPIKRSNKSNVVVGDNHALTGKKNNVIIGSADTEGTLTRASDAVIIGHNANATSDTGADNAVAIGLSAKAGGGNAVTIGVNTSAGDNSITIGSESSAISGSNIAIGRYARVYGDKVTNAVALGHNANAKVADGVAIGSGSEATVTGKSTEGYDPTTGKNSTETTSTWQATNAAVSIGTVDGKVTRQINGVAAGTNETDAVNVAQLKNATAGMTTKGLNFQGNNTDVTVHRDLGSTLTIKGNGTKDDSSYSADNIKVVGDANGSLTIMMDKEIKGDRITVGEKGEPGKEGQAGKDGVDGQIGVNGKDGSAVVINGTDGSIGLNGKDGANGLTIKGAKGDAGVDGTDGHDGKDGMTRIVYEDHNKVTHKVATLDDGMKYAGDFGDGAAVKLDKTVNIKGNVKEGAKSDDFVDGNIAVVANKKGDNGELQIKLNKNLTGLNSATYTTTTGEGESAKTSTTTVDGNGLTIMNGPSITNNGVDAGKKAITNVGSGASSITKDANGKDVYTYNTLTNAANVGDVKNIAASTESGMTTKGLNFQGNNTDVTVHRDLGSTLTIKGNGTKDDSSYSADNIKVVGDANGSLTIMMDKEIKGDRITVGEKGEPGKEGQAGKDGVDGQIGVNGKDGSAVVINGTDGSIGLNGKDGANGLTIKGAKGDAGVDGTDGHDGKDGMTRIVYEDHNKVTHKVATLDDGMKYAGDFGDGAAVKLDKTVNIKGNVKEGAKSDDFVDGNIAVVANKKGDNGELQIKLNKNLTGLNSATYTTTTGEGESAKTSTTTVDGNGLTIMNGPSITNNGVDAGKKAITNVGNGIEKDSAGKYTVTDQNKGNAANIGDVQNMVNEAVNSAADTTNRALAGKANVDASNIGANLKGEDGKAPASDAEKTANENAWGSAIGTGKIEKDNGQLVTGKTVYEYNKPVAEVGKTLNYVSEGKTTGQNLGALDAHVKTNADNIAKNTESIKNITNNVKNLSDNAVQYDKDSNKTKVTLGGDGGTTITNVKDGALNDSSTDAVNGKQLYAEQTARKELETKVTSNTTEINNIKDGQGFTDKGKEVIRDLAKGSVKVIAGTNTTVTPGTDEDGATTYAVNVEGNGKVDSGDKGLISGGTLYNEVRPTEDGNYVKKDKTTGQNLSALDTGLKTTSDLIHTNTAGDTIQIGGNSTAKKIDVNGNDGKGRVITGVVTDATDPTSAANVGYVNGVTAANTQQIYRDMNNAYGRLNNNINKAAAGSNALAALHPLDYDPDDKADFAVGYGHYRNANAAAVGAFYHPNENTMVNVGVSLGNGDPGFNAGVSFKVGRGGAGREAMSKTEMAKVINSQSKEIDALKKDNADKDKRIDALEQKMAEILAKLDKNGK